MTPPADAEAPPERLAKPIGQCVQMIYPTPIALYVWPESERFNAELRDLVLAEEAETPGLRISNVGGWHSPLDFLTRPLPLQRRLVGRIHAMVGDLAEKMKQAEGRQLHVEGWANVLRKGQYNSIHVHPSSTWSGVYYVTGNPPPEEGAGSPEFSGKIEFVDPRPGAIATYAIDNILQSRSLINPPAGAMLVFPSWLQHLVHPYFGPGERISIAFNVLIA